MSKGIQLNQQWRTRDGSIVRVTLDRGEGAFDGWRWLLSNGLVAHEDDGRVIFFEGKEGPGDLITLIEEPRPITKEEGDGMDSTWGFIPESP